MAMPLRAASALILAGSLLAGCADNNNNFFTTGALGSQQTAAAPEVDPACMTLATRIEVLRKEGIADKIEKAAAKKYKMTQADLVKADQLTKVSTEFQGRCSTVIQKPTTAQTSSAPMATASAVQTKSTPKASAPHATATPAPQN